MKPKGPKWLLTVALTILAVTALAAAVATAQDSAQDTQSGDLSLPTNTTGYYDTGNSQVTVHKPGESSTNSSDQIPEWAVFIRDYYFDLANVGVEPGSNVTWTNEGNEPHTVTADNGMFDSGVLYPGDSYTVWFGGAGTVTYHCDLHPSMTGSVVVG
jgi:plastocyanin